MMTATQHFDTVVIGGGIVGLATARALLERRPGSSLAVLEKESRVATHQTGNNSGVIHMGIYYKPGSLKARLCVRGADLMMQFCDVHGIPYDLCGKVIVATREDEIPRLDELERRGVANGVPGLRRIDAREIRELEPHAAGIAGLHSPHTGIVSYRRVAEAMVGEITAAGGTVITGVRLLDGHATSTGLELQTTAGTMEAGQLVNCGGLYADRIALMLGARPTLRIVPFRGEYYILRKERASLVRGLIYPTPDPAFPFLGVHFTKRIDGSVEAGPNAVPALAREGYGWTRIAPREALESFRYRGFQRLARTYWRTGAYEIVRSLSKTTFVRSLQALVPEIRRDDIVRGGAGVRAQAIAPDGKLVDDFAIVSSERAIHVLNAPSPAATASLAIGGYIADLVTGDSQSGEA